MTFDNFIIAICTLLSPLIAIQVSEWLNSLKQKREEQLRVFSTIMATRIANLDPRHVEALNLIDVVFSGQNKQEIEIRSKWKAYLDHLNNSNLNPDSWAASRITLFVDLTYEMAKYLRFDMDKTHIKNQCYFPTAHGDIEVEQNLIRKGVLSILKGDSGLKVSIDDTKKEPRSDLIPTLKN